MLGDRRLGDRHPIGEFADGRRTRSYEVEDRPPRRVGESVELRADIHEVRIRGCL
jgi:hypothetical protein